jgi:hypothetical protein
MLRSPILTLMSSCMDARANLAAPSGLSRTVITPSGPRGRTAKVPLWVIRPSAAVANLAEAIWDWDIPDGDAATGLTIKIPPSTAPYFVVQYRTLTHCRWQVGADSHDHKNYGHV